MIYKELCIITVIFEISSRNAEGNYFKTLNLISFDYFDVQKNEEIFCKQFKDLCLRNKIYGKKEIYLEKLETFIKGNNKFLTFVEIPSSIEINLESLNKFNSIKRLLEFSSKLLPK